VDFTIARMKDGSGDLSFSGIKTAVLYHVRREGIAPVAEGEEAPARVRDLLASFQRAVVAALVARLRQGAEEHRPRALLLTGGVAANSLLRAETARAALEIGLPLYVPPIALSTDNAAMIGAAGFVNHEKGVRAGWDLNAEPHLAL
jgi:N6-L-threonylcarbamoyladenine synthase